MATVAARTASAAQRTHTVAVVVKTPSARRGPVRASTLLSARPARAVDPVAWSVQARYGATAAHPMGTAAAMIHTVELAARHPGVNVVPVPKRIPPRPHLPLPLRENSSQSRPFLPPFYRYIDTYGKFGLSLYHFSTLGHRKRPPKSSGCITSRQGCHVQTRPDIYSD